VIGFLRALAQRVHDRLRPAAAKRRGELRYWQERAGIEGSLRSSHYEWFFKDHFGLTDCSYDAAAVLDVGCGPRGSLEWATAAALPVGADPLAYPYRELGTARHRMLYVSASAGALPFRTGTFDVVSSFNSLDHVDDLRATVVELMRVLKTGGEFLLLAEVNQPPTIVEPITLTWDAPELFESLEIIEARHYEVFATGIFDSIRADARYDHTNPVPRTGALSAHLRKR
jgi:SAM-dependent methyltransferase